tara:strand:- start:398 stop:949 length:552 start_codon:yes stop_codon:yes gene_type:complete
MKIDVYDNFFSKEIQKEIWKLMQRPKWSFNGGKQDHSFWHMNDLEQEEYFSIFLFNIICDKLGKKFKCIRVYANGQTAGQCGMPHDDDGHFTFLYFPNPEWKIHWHGHLHFLNKKGPDNYTEDGWPDTKEVSYQWEETDEIQHTITYKPNRAVLFPGTVIHYGGSPHRYYSGLRISLAYKLLT